MTHRSFIKCEVCGSIIMVRTQIGWLPRHPIRIHCAECGILISGECVQDQKNISFNIIFENAQELNYNEVDKVDFYIEVSGELLTSKIRTFSKEKDEYLPPPFFNCLWSMDGEHHETYIKFKKDVLQFLYFIEHDWPFVRRLHELWIAGNTKYLADQMRGYLSNEMFPLNNDLEYLRGIHQLFLTGFKTVLPQEFFNSTTKTIWKSISDISSQNINEFIKLTDFFNDNGSFLEYEKRILDILNSFISKYQFFITVKGLDSYNGQPDLLNNGTTTVSFEDVRYFYSECYEAIGEMISLVIAYNNLKYRNSFMNMPESSFNKVNNINDFMQMRNKGNKLTFCDTDEIFNEILCLDADNGLRNAIAHGSFNYDGINQIINYDSSITNGKQKQENIYLVDFIKKTWGLFHTVLILIELLYQTQKFYYVFHGITPIKPLLFTKKENW